MAASNGVGGTGISRDGICRHVEKFRKSGRMLTVQVYLLYGSECLLAWEAKLELDLHVKAPASPYQDTVLAFGVLR